MLSVTDLSCARGGILILEKLSFELAAGEALVLRGPNGIGKTTLLRCLAGLQSPESGQIESDEDLIAYAGHADGIKPALTVAENLIFWARMFGGADISPGLSAFDLEDLSDRIAGHLSAGQKRRLGLARLLVTGRPIWILDEPTVSLDTASVGLFAAAIRAHCAEGGAAIMATHIDLGLEASILDLTPYRARYAPDPVEDEAFL